MSKILKISILILFLSVFFLPFLVSAQEIQEIIEIKPPISEDIAKASPSVIIGKIIQWIMGIVGALAVLMIVWAGMQYMFSGGDERQIKQAKGILIWSIVGLLICIFAYTIVWFILEAVGQGV